MLLSQYATLRRTDTFINGDDLIKKIQDSEKCILLVIFIPPTIAQQGTINQQTYLILVIRRGIFRTSLVVKEQAASSFFFFLRGSVDNDDTALYLHRVLHLHVIV